MMNPNWMRGTVTTLWLGGYVAAPSLVRTPATRPNRPAGTRPRSQVLRRSLAARQSTCGGPLGSNVMQALMSACRFLRGVVVLQVGRIRAITWTLLDQPAIVRLGR